jgi:DNA primase
LSDLQEIKKRIFDEEKVELILDELDCWGIHDEQNGNLIVAGLPEGDNERSVQIKNNETLGSAIRSKGISGDIFNIVSYIIYSASSEAEMKLFLTKSKYWICNKLGYFEYIDEFYKVTSNTDIKPEYNRWLKKIHNGNTRLETNIERPIKILDYFGTIPYYDWVEKGLSVKTQKYFQIGIDVDDERITFPVFNTDGKLIGVKGRYCGKSKIKQDKYKYLYVIPCNKSIEFFNLNRALPYIKEKKEVIVVEGAKTVMYLYQWGFKNAISIEGDILTDAQVKILKKLGLDTKIIFVWDKDKPIDFIKQQSERLQGRLKYSIFDKNNLLKEKDSPTDKGEEIWNKLYKENKYKLK